MGNLGANVRPQASRLVETYTMNHNSPSPRPRPQCSWMQRPLAPCELAPEGRPGMLLLMSSLGNGVIRFDDAYHIEYRLGVDNWHIVGYTVRKANGKEFEFDGLLPRAEAIVAAVEELDPPAADRAVP